MELELRAYRANPTDSRFADVFRVARPWLKATGISTVKKYPRLSISGSLDDVVLEGALALPAPGALHPAQGSVAAHGHDVQDVGREVPIDASALRHVAD